MRFFPKKYQLVKQKFDRVSHITCEYCIICIVVNQIFNKYLGSPGIKIISFEREDMCDRCIHENAFINDKTLF